MNIVITFLKEKKLILLATISVLSIILIISLTNKKREGVVNPNPTTQSHVQIAKYKDISTGEEFNEDKINNLLGFPTESTSSGEVKINKYRSSNEYRTNEIMIENNEVDFIREVVNPDDNKNSNDIRKIYGISNVILYEKYSDSILDLYVYPNNGIAYLGHIDGGIFEIWYFKPTDIDSFIEKYAQNYQKTPFTEQTGH